jgi:D-serine deaminase-like pyridoxal phosphate-dependent protein
MNISTPTVLLNWEVAQANISRMAELAKINGLHFRPHFKTHQCQVIGRHFRRFGVDAITVSSFAMAEYFACDGWTDITVAFPVNVREIDAIERLASKISLNLLVVNPESLATLGNRLGSGVGIFIKIDVGTHRTGLAPADFSSIEAILQGIERSPMLQFRGFLAHAGHSYKARSKAGILAVHEETIPLMLHLKEKYRRHFPGIIVSVGDTPTCSVAENWEGIDEIRPGNFIFYDLMQVQIGSCSMEDIAVVLACPVVAKHPDRCEVILYGGAVHLSKDRMSWQGNEVFGLPVLLKAGGWELPEPDCFMRSVSQEHGVIKCSPSFFEKTALGGLLGILPVHSCLTVDLANVYHTTGGEIWSKM